MPALCTENYTTPLKEILKALNKWKAISCSSIGNKMTIIHKWIYWFNAITIKILVAILAEIDKLFLKFIPKCKELKKKQNHLEKEQQMCRIHTSQFQNLLQSYCNQDCVVLA